MRLRGRWRRRWRTGENNFSGAAKKPNFAAMTRQQLVSAIRSMGSYLCVGLDTDPEKIPKHLHSGADPIFEFNRRIIDATREHCVAYKVNTAFYEAMGVKGWEAMERTAAYIPSTH